MRVWLLSVVNGSPRFPPLFSQIPRIRLHMCITRAIVHALDTFPRINWPRNYEMCRFQRATMARELRGEANPERERERRIRCTYVHPTLTIRPRTHPAHPSNSLRTRDTGAPCVWRVLRATCHVCASGSRQERPHSSYTWTCTCRPAYHLIAISFVNI